MTLSNKLDQVKSLINDNLFHEFNPDFTMIDANKASTKMDESNFKTIKRTRISHKGKNNKHIIKLDDKSCFNSCSCNCKTFIKFGICPHLLAFSSINNLNIYESHSSVDKFVQKTKKGRKGRNKLAGKALAFD